MAFYPKIPLYFHEKKRIFTQYLENRYVSHIGCFLIFKEFSKERDCIASHINPYNSLPKNDKYLNMNCLLKIFLVICLGWASLASGMAQKQEMARFDHFTVKDGLSSDYVLAISSDSFGHIWASTLCGLNRFDGSTFKLFQIKDYPSLFRNDGKNITSLSNGKVIIGGYLGMLVQYNEKTDLFEDLSLSFNDSTGHKEIAGFYHAPNGDIYVCTTKGIYIYDKKAERFSNNFPAFNAMSDLSIRSLHIDKMERFWACSHNTLHIFSKEGTFIRKFDLADEHKQMFISQLYPMNDSTLLASSFSDIIFYFNINADGEISQTSSLKTPFYNISGLLRDRFGNYWFASDGNGLWFSDKIPQNVNDFTKIIPYEAEKNTFDKVYAIAEDYEGNIWAGTKNSGLWKYKRKDSYGLITSADVRYPHSSCCDFDETSKGELLIASDGGGLTLSSLDFSQSKNIDTDNKNVVNIANDQKGTFWIATWGGGIYTYDANKQTITPCTFDGLRTKLNCFFSATVMKNGEVWVGTAGDGIYVRNTNGQWQKRLPNAPNTESEKWVYKVVEGRSDSRWVLTPRAIWRCRCAEMRPVLFSTPNKDKHNPLAIYDAVCDQDGQLFAATSKYILRYSADGYHCDTLNYVPEGEYGSICIGKDGILYTSGSNGILAIDTKENTCKPYASDFSDKGANYFSLRSGFCDSNGRLFFGCNDGFLAFDPSQNDENNTIRHFAISDIFISGARPETFGRILPNGSISNAQSITLNHDETEIEFNIDIINYSGFKALCDYRLIGLNDKWTRVESNHKINFSYIPSGEYTLELRAYKPDLPNDVKTISLHITVLPPWWETWWFRALLLLFIGSLIAIGLSHRIKRITKQKKILEQKVMERTKELNEANQEITQQNNFLKENQILIEMKNEELSNALSSKDRILSIIAHDLKNPMFGIASAMDRLSKDATSISDEQKRKIIADVAESAKSLQTELSKLLQWATAQNEEMPYLPMETTIPLIIKDNISFFKNLSAEKSLKLTFSNEVQSKAFVDPRMIAVVIRNLIANAIKFTPNDGNIDIKAWEDEGHIFVSVHDNGVGMSEEQKQKIFSGESTLGTNNEKGTGLGLKACKQLLDLMKSEMTIESEKGKGTNFTIKMPMAIDLVKEREEKRAEKINRLEDLNFSLLDETSILIVEDDSLIRLHIRKLLEQFMIVTEASNGAEALEIINQNRPDIILSDVEMPVMDGIAFAKNIHSQEETASIPFLFLSARNSDADRLNGLLSGAIDYLSKPFVDDELLIKLCNILMTQQAQTKMILAQQMENISKGESSEETPDKTIISPMLERIMASIENRYKDSNFSIDDICADLEMSQSTLNRKLKMLTGKTSNTLINEYRLHKAKYLLENSDMNISEIAYEVGFNDPHYFSKKFKTLFGIPPSKSNNA